LPELDDALVAHLVAEQDAVGVELEQLRARAADLKRALEDLWASECAAEYELTSVFIHRGSSPSFGHYFFYSRHLPEKPDEWFKYNDSEVSVVPKDEVLADTTGETANPYMVRHLRLFFRVRRQSLTARAAGVCPQGCRYDRHGRQDRRWRVRRVAW
jgi:ubiquitin carboxyl-terminal hydrolase 25/28